MLALGALLTCAAVLGIGLAALVFRRPNPPRWTTRSWAGDAVAIGLVCGLALGIGYLSAGAIDAYEQGLRAIDLGLLAAVLVLSLVVWRKLDVRQRLRSMAAEERASVAGSPPHGASADTPPASTTERPPLGPADRAA